MRTDKEIVDQTNELARSFYKAQGCEVRKGYRFDRAFHPQEQGMWSLACIAQMMLTQTDPRDALANM